MHNVVALETNPTSGTCCANFKNVVSAAARGCTAALGQVRGCAGMLGGPQEGFVGGSQGCWLPGSDAWLSPP